jgi:hypothetical protein
MIRTSIESDSSNIIVVDYDRKYDSGHVQIGVKYRSEDVINWGFLDKKQLADLIVVLQYYQAIEEGKIQE